MIEAREGLVDEVIALAAEVHRTLGPGLVAPVYVQALQRELALAGLRGGRRSIAVSYKGSLLASGLDAELVVEDSLVLEVQAIDRFSTLHIARLVSYLRLLGIRRGLLVNFNAIALKSGIRRISV